MPFPPKIQALVDHLKKEIPGATIVTNKYSYTNTANMVEFDVELGKQTCHVRWIGIGDEANKVMCTWELRDFDSERCSLDKAGEWVIAKLWRNS